MVPFCPSCAASVARETKPNTASVSAEVATAENVGAKHRGRTRKTRLDSFAVSSASVGDVASTAGEPALSAAPLAPRTFFFFGFPFSEVPGDPFCRACNFGAMLTSVFVVSNRALPEAEGSSDTQACVRLKIYMRRHELTYSEANPCAPQYPDVDLLPQCGHPHLREQG